MANFEFISKLNIDKSKKIGQINKDLKQTGLEILDFGNLSDSNSVSSGSSEEDKDTVHDFLQKSFVRPNYTR